MADIALLLIVFLLLTTSLKRDQGLALKLPSMGSSKPLQEQEPGAPRIAASPPTTARKKESSTDQPSQLSLFGGGPDPIRDKLKGVKPDDLSPREALDLLYELKKM